MKNIFYFWEEVKWYDVRVLNEREARWASGILFTLALIIFLSWCINGNFQLIKVFIAIFMLDFFIRVFINPKFSPSMIIARIFTQNQKVEYVWAPQKRFAWSIGFALAFFVFILTTFFWYFWPITVLSCFFCLIFLFFETVFWICLWCNVYNFFNKEKAKYCPGWVCEIKKKENIQNIWIWTIIILISFFIISFILIKIYYSWIVNNSIILGCTIDQENWCIFWNSKTNEKVFDINNFQK